jgi:3-oxoacid CoA-transferase subunit B
MDLVVGAKRIIVLMEHLTRDGRPRVRREWTLPLTGAGVANRLITDLAVFDFAPSPQREIRLVERFAEISLQELRECTEAPLVDSTKEEQRHGR